MTVWMGMWHNIVYRAETAGFSLILLHILCTTQHHIPEDNHLARFWSFHRGSVETNKNQLDATLCSFYFCRVALHVSGASTHHQEYLKVVRWPLVRVLSLQVSHHITLLGPELNAFDLYYDARKNKIKKKSSVENSGLLESDAARRWLLPCQ